MSKPTKVLLAGLVAVALAACGRRNEHGETVDKVLDRTNDVTIPHICGSILKLGYDAALREWLAPATDKNPFGVVGPKNREFQEALFEEAASRYLNLTEALAPAVFTSRLFSLG